VLPSWRVPAAVGIVQVNELYSVSEEVLLNVPWSSPDYELLREQLRQNLEMPTGVVRDLTVLGLVVKVNLVMSEVMGQVC
jgi:hypothetical protein